MKLPIYVYGEPVLRQVAEDITPEYPELKQLIANMYETLENAEGVGLAALSAHIFDLADIRAEELLARCNADVLGRAGDYRYIDYRLISNCLVVVDSAVRVRFFESLSYLRPIGYSMDFYIHSV